MTQQRREWWDACWRWEGGNHQTGSLAWNISKNKSLGYLVADDAYGCVALIPCTNPINLAPKNPVVARLVFAAVASGLE